MPELAVRRLLLKNTSIQIVAQAVGLITGLGNSLVLSRYLGVEGFGQFNYIFAFYYFFLTINDFGVNWIVVRQVSQQRERAAEIIGAMLTFKLALAVASLAVAAIVVWMLDMSSELQNSLWIFGFILPAMALQLPAVIFQVNLKPGYPAAVGIVNRCLGFILILSTVAIGGGLVMVTTCLVVIEFVSLALLTFGTRQAVRPVWSISWPIWKEILQSSVPLGLAGLCTALINRIDFIMLERMTNLHELGLYSAAYKVTNLLESLPLLVMGTVYPLMSQWAKDDPPRMKRLYRQTMILLGVLALPIGLVTTVAAPWAVPLVFGSDFEGTVPALQVLVWSTVSLYLAITSGNLLISLGRERINLVLNIFGAGLNIGLNFWLIPRWGFIGAAWATTATFVFVLIGVSIASALALHRISPQPVGVRLQSGNVSA
jgi:O-antigen/teichoic acid export membrane protein